MTGLQPEPRRLLDSLTGNCARDRAALLELADMAATNEAVLRAVVEHFPRRTTLRPEASPEVERLRGELAVRWSRCVAGLITILDEFADSVDRKSEDSDRLQCRAEYATEILGEIGEPARAATAAIVRAMHANPRGVGEFAGTALGKIGGEEAIRELNRIWFSGWDRKLCESCHGGLANLGEAAHATLERILEGNDELERARALSSLRAAGYPASALAAKVLEGPRREAKRP